MMKCPKCGSEWNDNAVFCGACGAKMPRKSFGYAVKMTLLSLLFVGIMLAAQTCTTAFHITSTLANDQSLKSALESYAAVTADPSSTPEMLEIANESYMSAYTTAAESATKYTLAHTSSLLLIGDLVALLVVFLIFRIRRRAPLKELNFRMCNPGRLATFAVFGAVLSFTLSTVLSMIPFPEWIISSYNDSVSILFENKDSIAMQVLSTALVTPIIEEIVFRAIPMKYIKPAAGRVGTIIISALIFGLAHYSFNAGSLIQVAYATVLGVVFALIYDKYDSVIPSILCHMGFNLLSFVPEKILLKSPVIAAVIGIALTAFFAYRIFYRSPTFSDVLFDPAIITPNNDEERNIIRRVHQIRESTEPVRHDEIDSLADAWDKSRKEHRAKRSSKSDADTGDKYYRDNSEE